MKQLIVFLFIIFHLGIFGQNCSNAPNHFDSYEEAEEFVYSHEFEFSKTCNTSSSSWITCAKWYSCDGVTGYFLICIGQKTYLHTGLPLYIFQNLCNSTSIGSYYDTYIRGRYRLYVGE